MASAMAGLRIARGGGAATILNPAPAAVLPEAMRSLCDYVTAKETEAETTSGVKVTDLSSARAAIGALLATRA